MPRYVNSPQTPSTASPTLLFGLAEAPALARGARPAIVEGPLDAIAVSSGTDGRCAGLAACGTALTGAHADALAAAVDLRASGLVVAMDADDAGLTSARSALELFSPRGVSPTAALLPTGSDPASLLTTTARPRSPPPSSTVPSPWPIALWTPRSLQPPRGWTGWRADSTRPGSSHPSSPPCPWMTSAARPRGSRRASTSASASSNARSSRSSASNAHRTSPRGHHPRRRRARPGCWHRAESRNALAPYVEPSPQPLTKEHLVRAPLPLRRTENLVDQAIDVAIMVGLGILVLVGFATSYRTLRDLAATEGGYPSGSRPRCRSASTSESSC